MGIFKGLDSDLSLYDGRRGMHGINYKLLDDGHTGEVRFVLGKVIMDTMSDESLCASTDDDAFARKPVVDLAGGGKHPLSDSGES